MKFLPIYLLLFTFNANAQPVVEFRSYILKPGTREAFHRLVVERSLPMLERWHISVLGYGPSLQEDSSYYLIRSYPGLEAKQASEDAFYGSTEWKQGPREAIISRISYYTTVIVPADTILRLADRLTAAAHTSDSLILSDLNKQFIANFIHQDTTSHNRLIDPDFVCIESDGSIVPRKAYMYEWATAYSKSGYTSFSITGEHIRLFGNTALVRSKTIYTKQINGKSIKGSSVYTDTYVKKNGAWKCVQAQITSVR